ncbi:MAG: cation-translocating P-type ATPase [Patescibacteria group bacterium]|nr:cation-translocating P-type ATPase [Patescibacteria group bacterium]
MKTGLSQQEAKKRLGIFGKNIIQVEKKFSALKLFLSQFPSFINGILLFAAVVSFFISDSLDGFFIIAILILNSLLGFFQEYKAEKSLEKLKTFSQETVRVLRDGKQIEVREEEIVPGDLVFISEGDRLPADGTLDTAHTIEIDESILTGESIPVEKKDKDKAFKGTLVARGKGFLLVEKTGLNTRFGQIAQTLGNMEEGKSPLEIRLNSLGKVLSFIALFSALLLIPIGLIQGKELIPLVLVAVSIGIAAIPESLPAVVTIALAIGTNRMTKRKAIVRKMQAIETLGAMQVVLIDKTGTLTQNKMKVKKVWMKNEKLSKDLLKACVFGNTASLLKKEKKDEYDILGDKTDGALLLYAKEKIDDLDSFKNSLELVDEHSFDPLTRTITTVLKEDGKAYVFIKGAPEEIVSRSSLYQKEKEEIKRIYEAYASSGLRIIGFAKKELRTSKLNKEDLEKNLEFIGIIGIYDPPRIEAKQAVLDAKKAGIRTVMVTGDNELTALSIAEEVGLIEKEEDVITGEKMDKLSDHELQNILLKTRIFARAKPEDKLRLVHAYKKLGYVVGVTGDGVNDALALKKADIGIAMGEEGTDVAKEASDIVLTDDNFASLVHAIEEGRVIYRNILKSITYLLSGNIAELGIIFLGISFGLPSPLLPTQILWINLVTDGLPALALAQDTKDSKLLYEKPRDANEPIISNNRLVLIFGIGISLSIFLFIVFSFLLRGTTITHARTIVFNLLIFCHLLLSFAVRGKSIFKPNRLLIFTVIATIILQVIITTHPFFQEIFHLGF